MTKPNTYPKDSAVDVTVVREILTHDGYPVRAGSYYHTVDGQQVILHQVVFDVDGNPKFEVSPFYEGEAMTCSGDGGTHHEYSADYEVEGEPVLMDGIYEKAPTNKLCKGVKKLKREIIASSKTLGMLKQTNLELEKANKELSIQLETKKNHLLVVADKLEMARKTVNNLSA